MQERVHIRESYLRETGLGRWCVLATLVHTEGSTYRKPGAKMLLAESGRSYGMISGGCFDQELMELAIKCADSQRPRLVVFDLREDSDALFGFGLGCQGALWVLIEPLPFEATEAHLDLLLGQRRGDFEHVVATVFDGNQFGSHRVGARLLVSQEAMYDYGFGEQQFLTEVGESARTALLNRCSSRKKFYNSSTEIDVFFEYRPLDTSCLIIGAGEDAVPLHEQIASLGWRVNVVDHRPAYAQKERFPKAESVQLMVAEDAARLEALSANVVFLMTHNYGVDLGWLRALNSSCPSYLGLLGPKQRGDRLFKELEEEGVSMRCEAIYYPCGLAIGCDSPASIALSMAAEAHCVVRATAPSHLRDQKRKRRKRAVH